MGIKVEAAVYNTIGGRKNNEDNFYLNGVYMKRGQMDMGGQASVISAQPLQLYAVFDGMGGGDFGEDASFYAASRTEKYQKTCNHPDNEQNLRAFLTEVSQGIDSISASHGMKSGSCGSTAAMLYIGNWWFRTAHIGDSRVYLLRDGELKRATKDQSEVQRMVDSGRITQDEAWSHPRKNVITHHLGMPLPNGALESVISDRTALQEGDCFLICSDGVNDSLRDWDIQEMLDARESAALNAGRIARRAKKHSDEMGVQSDNITAIVIKILKVGTGDEDDRRVRRLSIIQKLLATCTAACALGALGTLLRIIKIF